MQAIFGHKGHVRARGAAPVVALVVGCLVSLEACGNTIDSGNAGGAPGAGAEAGDSAADAGGAGASGAQHTSVTGAAGSAAEGGSAGMNDADDAGAAGTPALGGTGGVGGTSGGGTGGTAGAPPQTGACLPGGTLFAVGNYVDGSGNELWLRSNAKATTLALITHGPAKPAKPPQIWLIERVCSSGSALIAKDPSSAYRVDFSFLGSTLAVCTSVAAASVDAALALAPADFGHALDTGCLGKPFSVFLPEVTP